MRSVVGGRRLREAKDATLSGSKLEGEDISHQQS
jgi:hypothetical protein